MGWRGAVPGHREQCCDAHFGGTFGAPGELGGVPGPRYDFGREGRPLLGWRGGRFPVPEAAQKQYGLSSDAFMKKTVDASSRYIKDRELGASCCSDVATVGSSSRSVTSPAPCQQGRSHKPSFMLKDFLGSGEN